MSRDTSKYLKFGSVTVLILLSLAYLAYTGVQDSKSYYVTIMELRGMGESAYTKRLRVAGHVQTGSIKREGTKIDFALVENGQLLNVVYSGTEAPPDTFKDDSQALADGSFGRRRRLPRHAAPSEVCFQVCAPTTGHSCKRACEHDGSTGDKFCGNGQLG